MQTLVATADSALVRRLSRRLGRKHVSVGMPDEAGVCEIRVPETFSDDGMAAVRRLLDKQPWRRLSADARTLFVRRHIGFIAQVARQAERSPQTVSAVWHGHDTSRWIELHITAAYRRITETV